MNVKKYRFRQAIVINKSKISMDIIQKITFRQIWKKRDKEEIKPLSVRVNFLWNFLGNAIYGGSQWGMMMLLTKITSPEIVGQYALGFAICNPVILLTNMQLRNVQAVDTDEKYSFGHYLTLRIITTIISIFIILFVLLLGKYSPETNRVILAVALLTSLVSLNDIYYGLYQHYERFDRIGISKINKAILMILSFGLGVYFTRSCFWGLIFTSSAYLLNLFFYDIPQGALLIKSRRKQEHLTDHFLDRYGLRLIWNLNPLFKLAWLAFPLGLVMVMLSLNSNIPLYVIAHTIGEKYLGLYGAISYPIMIGGSVVFAMGASAAPAHGKIFYATE